MEQNRNQQAQVDDYKQLFKVCGNVTFISQPKKYIIVFLLFQAGSLIYFLVTINQASIALKIITIATYFIITLIELLFPFVDPGIVPKISPKTEKNNIPKNMLTIRQGREGNYYREYSSVAKTHSFLIKYCGSCSIYRPPRTLHCYTCEICIQKLDHHCPWLGTCIGKRNYRFYILYVFFMAVDLSLICYQCVDFIISRSFSGAQVQYIFNILLLVMSSPCALFVLLLIGLHIKLSIQNMTTNELWHKKWDLSSGNPFQKTFFLKNCVKIFGNIYKSKYEFQQSHLNQLSVKVQTESQHNYKKADTSQVPTAYGSECHQQLRGVEFVLKLR